LAIRKSTLVLLTLLWLIILTGQQGLDFRFCHQDIGKFLSITLDLVDDQIFPMHGASIVKGIHLGPFANYLAAIPLLISRDIHFQYYFLCVLLVLSVFLFFQACREIDPKGTFSIVATISYAFTVLALYPPKCAEHTYFLPFFLTLYLFLLVRSFRKPMFYILPVWVLAALACHLHFCCILLVPTTLFASMVAPYRPSAWTKSLNLGGLVLVVLLQSHLLEEIKPLFGQDVNLVRNSLLFGGTFSVWLLGYAKVFLYWLVEIPPVLGPAIVFFGSPGLIFLSKILKKLPDYRPILLTSAFFILGGMIVCPLMDLLKNTFSEATFSLCYFFPSVIFWPLLIGGFFQWIAISQPPNVFGKRVHLLFRTLVLFSILWVILHVFLLPIIGGKSYWQMMRLDEILHVNERVAEQIKERDLRDLEIPELVFIKAGDSPQLQSYSNVNQKALLLYRYPEWKDRFAEGPGEFLGVFIIPRHLGPVGSFLKPPENAEKLDEFQTDHLSVALYLGPREFFPDPQE